jgi:hypothetical protein
MLDRSGHSGEANLQVPCEQIGQRRRGAAIGHMDHVNVRHYLEQFAGQMSDAPNSRRGHGDFARVSLGVNDQLRKCFCS